eukprot:3312903-Rhodomonas_salina.2
MPVQRRRLEPSLRTNGLKGLFRDSRARRLQVSLHVQRIAGPCGHRLVILERDGRRAEVVRMQVGCDNAAARVHLGLRCSVFEPDVARPHFADVHDVDTSPRSRRHHEEERPHEERER